MLGVLRLITPENPTLLPEQVCAAFECGISTAYRYIRELVAAGLLVRLPGGYALGPRIIQLDLQMRSTDPMLHHGRDLMLELVRQTGLSTLLSELYDDMVITLHEESGQGMAALGFGRGRAMPLHRGATSRVILAYLPPRPMRRTYDRIAATQQGASELPSWKEFVKEMRTLRTHGYCLTRGQVEGGKSGLAAPILDEEGRVLGSITVVGDDQKFDMFNEPHLARLVCAAAASLTTRIATAPQGDPVPVPIDRKRRVP